MATDIVPTLFGVTTDSYRQSQQDRADAQAMKFAQLDPFQQANYAIGRGAYGLAGAVGGALGGQDPELQRISMRQQIAGQVDWGDPQSLLAGGRELARRGDIVGAMQAADAARKLESEMAQQYQRQAAGEASLADAAQKQTKTASIRQQQAIFDQLYPAAPAVAPAPVAPGITDPDTGAVVTRVAPPSAAMGTAITAMLPVGEAVPAVPVPAQTRADIERKIADLRKREDVLLSLPDIPGAVAKAKPIGEDIKVLQASIAPTELARLEGEIARLEVEGVPRTDTRIVNRLSKIAKLVENVPPAIAELKAYQALSPSDKAAFTQLLASKRPPGTIVNMPNEAERKAATLANRLNFSVDQINQAIGIDPTAAMPNTSTELARFLSRSDMLANKMTTAQRQIVEAAQLDILDAALTLGTGAAYTKDQLEGYRKSYFPQVNDKPENVAAKRARLQNILRSAEIASGRAKVPTPMPSPGADLSSIITAPASK